MREGGYERGRVKEGGYERGRVREGGYERGMVREGGYERGRVRGREGMREGGKRQRGKRCTWKREGCFSYFSHLPEIEFFVCVGLVYFIQCYSLHFSS